MFISRGTKYYVNIDANVLPLMGSAVVVVLGAGVVDFGDETRWNLMRGTPGRGTVHIIIM